MPPRPLNNDRDVAFVAIDEGQVGADPTRGHVFTDRLLHARGYAETMILGSETLRPLIRRLLPDFEIITRPRFSTLSYTPPRKLSRLPKRSVIVAFTAAQVYALAEMLRRQMGGAAVVMGSLSPRTRNAQVAMYQSGEVDYLVATDAIGMGLNMDIAHVAFAALDKFDGHRKRRLTPSEMAQIAGRAGRYQRDGTFGIVQLGGAGATAFEPEEVERIEGHHFAPLAQLVWRNAALDFSTMPKLVATLEARPPVHALVRGDEAIDLAVLKRLAGEPWAMERAHGIRTGMARLWAACSLPDYRKTGAEMHARLVGRVFRHLTEGDGRLPSGWIASEVAALDNVAGDIAAIADRIAAVRTWTYIANHPGWLDEAAHWAARTRDLENRLSDALHTALTQRFVDRRTGLLLRDLKMRGGALRVAVDADGTVAVEGEPIGKLHGFRFAADPSARAGEKRLLLAAAERHLPAEFSRRTAALVAAPDSAFDLVFNGTLPPAVTWNGARVASLHAGRDTLNPRIEIDVDVAARCPDDRARIAARLKAWVAALRARHLAPLMQLSGLAAQFSPAARGLVVQLVETMGCLHRAAVAAQIAALTSADRRLLAQCRVRLGFVHVYVDQLLRPEPTRWRLAFWAVAQRSALGLETLPPPPSPGSVTIDVATDVVPGFYDVAGFMAVGNQAVRIDMIDRLARAVHGISAGQAPFVPDAAWVASIGLRPDGFVRLMRTLGYRLRLVDGNRAFAWRGMRSARPERVAAAPASAFSPFAMLADHPARSLAH